jgi:acyl-coenzyme A thioesterase PaaI-like protein
MSNLARTVSKVKNYPKWVLSFLIGRTVRFVGTAGISFEEMTTERVIASIENKPKNRNHIGQIHAAAMILLAETATGMLVGMNIDDNKIPLIKSIKTNFVRRSLGGMIAIATITEEQKDLMKSQDKGEILVQVSVTDESGQAPIECEMLWAWITKKAK